MFTRETRNHLYETHGDLTMAMFTRGLTAAERRRLARVRSALDRLQSTDVWRYHIASLFRGGRASRIAFRKYWRLARFGANWNHEVDHTPPRAGSEG